MVLCMQNSDFITWITSLYRSQPSSEVFACKPATFGPKLHVSMTQNSPVIFCMQNSVPSIRITSLYGSQPSTVVFACKTATYGPEKQVSMGPRHDLSLCECKTAWLASVSMDPSTHLLFLHAKQRLLDPNNKSLWVPDITCRFVHAIQRD